MSQLSRREFISKSAAGASAVALASGVARGFPANEKVQLGWIGYGGRATGLMQHMLQRCPDAANVAICDLKPDRVDAGRQPQDVLGDPPLVRRGHGPPQHHDAAVRRHLNAGRGAQGARPGQDRLVFGAAVGRRDRGRRS